MKRIINNSIQRPMTMISMTFMLSLFIMSGMRWFVIDDDFFKMFPKDIESRILWEDMTDEFGDSELLLIAFGEKNQSIYKEQMQFPKLVHQVENIENANKVKIKSK